MTCRNLVPRVSHLTAPWDERIKCEHYSYKVVIVLAKLTLFVQSVNIICTKSSLSLQSWRCSYKVWRLFAQSCRCPCKVVVVRTKLTLFEQSCCCPCKVDVVHTKLSLFFAQSWRCLHKVLYKESWQINIDIKTASYTLSSLQRCATYMSSDPKHRTRSGKPEILIHGYLNVKQQKSNFCLLLLSHFAMKSNCLHCPENI